MDMGRDFPQQHVRYSGDAERNLGFRYSQPGSYLHSYLQQRRQFPILLHATWCLLRHGGHGHCGECDSITHAHAHIHALVHADANANTSRCGRVLSQFHNS